MSAMWWKLTAIIGVPVLLIAGALFAGSKRWESATAALHARMEAASVPVTPTTFDPSELEGLPAPVQRYFRTVLKEGQRLIASARVEHSGTFNVGETEDRWTPFSSRQYVITRRPGFVWDARNRMAPGITAYVHDAYVAGEGVLTATLFGLVTVMRQPNSPELAHGELMRFFAEAAWYPTALLPSQGVVWEPVDEDQASATLTDGATTVKLVFQFDSDGLISSVRSEGRYRSVGGVNVLTPWQGRYWNYEERDGMLIPLDGEVAWLLEAGPKPYWRGHIERIAYEFAK